MRLTKLEIRNLCKYFFESGSAGFSGNNFDRVFETEWQSKRMLRKISSQNLKKQSETSDE